MGITTVTIVITGTRSLLAFLNHDATCMGTHTVMVVITGTGSLGVYCERSCRVHSLYRELINVNEKRGGFPLLPFGRSVYFPFFIFGSSSTLLFLFHLMLPSLVFCPLLVNHRRGCSGHINFFLIFQPFKKNLENTNLGLDPILPK